MSFSFDITATAGAARAGVFVTPHGAVETPAFMPVGTLASVKTLDPDDLRTAGASMILANAYHLHLRPGEDVVRSMGGLHSFMHWDGPLLTDSGGFQVFSLEGLRKVSEDGVEFRSHIDGSARFFTPESVIQIEHELGADVIMQFDHVIPGQSEFGAARDASERSLRWLKRCLDRHLGLCAEQSDRPGQSLFPIIQGGIHEELRRNAANAVGSMHDWDGFAVGGLSVGEEKDAMYRMLDVVESVLPGSKPRYLMGVGFPEDLLECIARGVDMMDCVAPTRMGRNGAFFTPTGRSNIKRSEFRTDPRPLDESCSCAGCGRFTRAYVRHLFVSGEMLGLRLLSLHNVHFLLSLAREARARIAAGDFQSWSTNWLERYHTSNKASS